MKSNQTTRVLDLLKRFNNNETVCIDKIIEEASLDAQDHVPNIWLNSENKPVNDKTIRRVLDVLKPYFNFELINAQEKLKSDILRPQSFFIDSIFKSSIAIKE